jgi:phosphoglycolate phosphatase
MDGTLVNSSIMIANTINHVRKNIGLDSMEDKKILQAINDPDIYAPEFFYNTKDYTNEQHKLFEDYYHLHCIDEVELYIGIQKLLQDIKKHDIKITIATNASTIFAHKILEHLHIRDMFDYIVGANKVKNSKPHSDMIDLTLENLQIDAKDAILVGDSQKDILAGKSAGVESILVNWGFSDHTQNDKSVKSVAELSKILLDKISKN